MAASPLHSCSAAIMLFAAALAGCANPWQQSYYGARLPPLDPNAPVALTESIEAVLYKGPGPTGFVYIGGSQFNSAAVAGNDELLVAARSVGATNVLYYRRQFGSDINPISLPSEPTAASATTPQGEPAVWRAVRTTGAVGTWLHAAAFFVPQPAVVAPVPPTPTAPQTTP